MTRNTLMGGVLAGILFLSTLALADDPPKAMTALVFIKDAYAGRVQDLRSMSLEPGVYSLRIETKVVRVLRAEFTYSAEERWRLKPI